MPNEELLMIREASLNNMEDIERRQKKNDPLEVRKIPYTDIETDTGVPLMWYELGDMIGLIGIQVAEVDPGFVIDDETFV